MTTPTHPDHLNPPGHLQDDRLLLLNEYGLSDRDAAQAFAHLESCARCRGRRDALRVADVALLQMGTPEHAGPDDGRGRRQFEQRLSEAPAASHGIRPAVLAAAAACVLAVTGGQLLGPARRAASFPGRPAVSETRALPIRSITPGATVAMDVNELCRQMPWEVSPIPAAVKDDVLRAYGMERTPDHEYELDYLITPDLGGAPDPRNLWPEPYHSPVWNARVKDELESLLPRLVCEGKVDLRTAQEDIAVNWIAAYKKYFRTDRPLRQS